MNLKANQQPDKKKKQRNKKGKGIRNPSIMLVGETKRKESRSICVTFA